MISAVDRKLLICGTRSLAEEVADLVSEIPGFELAGFVENWQRDRCNSPLLGLPVIWYEELPRYVNSHCAVVALATTRRSLFCDQVAAAGLPFATLVHPSARVSPSARLGEGCIISAGVIIAAHTTLGRHVFVNRGALIGHHTSIGDYVSIMPGANIAGNTRIGEHTYVGMSAIVLDNICIGESCVVAAGALVTKDAPPHVQLMGLPAVVVKQNIEGR
jgi:sugar O-acyltransferase (sialic acid O-acetyltransferase NeuD family)